MLIFDTEGDGLATPKVEMIPAKDLPPELLLGGEDPEEKIKIVSPPATKFHIFGWTTDGVNVHTSVDPEPFIMALDKADRAGCHNCIRHDFPLLERLVGYTYEGLKVDTLELSWTLFPNRPKHGLEDWGNELGVKKVEVQSHQWKEGDVELMRERVTEDVKINWKLWEKQDRFLRELYSREQKSSPRE